jgi:hypothetical protein
MSDDLVKHLRSGDVSIKMPDGSIQYVNHVAADRIEQLEAALRNIYDKWENGVGICDVIDAMDAAHAALGEKKDD